MNFYNNILSRERRSYWKIRVLVKIDRKVEDPHAYESRTLIPSPFTTPHPIINPFPIIKPVNAVDSSEWKSCYKRVENQEKKFSLSKIGTLSTLERYSSARI